MATVHANGVDLRVNRYRIGPDGTRPVVVFVHGLGIVDHSGLAFTLGMPLADEAETVLYALRGHGHSQVTPSGYRVADHVTDRRLDRGAHRCEERIGTDRAGRAHQLPPGLSRRPTVDVRSCC